MTIDLVHHLISAVADTTRAGFLVLACACLVSSSHAADGPRPPCGAPAIPPYPEVGAPATVRTWTVEDLTDHWSAPECLGWAERDYGLLVTVTGRFDGVWQERVLLDRIGAVSRSMDVLYWSYSRKTWHGLFAEAFALMGPDRDLRRPDFNPEELRPGSDYFLWNKENSPASGTLLRMRFEEISGDRIVFSHANVNTSRLLFAWALSPGQYESVFFLDRQAADVWRYYSLTRFGSSSWHVTQRQTASLVNRLVALYRHLGAIPMTREPPAAP